MYMLKCVIDGSDNPYLTSDTSPNLVKRFHPVLTEEIQQNGWQLLINNSVPCSKQQSEYTRKYSMEIVL